MTHTLLVFHGFIMNGEVMRAALEPLATALEPKVRLVCLNAPHACSAATVERMYRGSSDPAFRIALSAGARERARSTAATGFGLISTNTAG